MSIAEKLQTVAENQQKVYDAGKQAKYDAFWDQFQNHGIEILYINAFCYNRFSDDTYNPKYPIAISESTTGADMMFYESGLTDTKVPIYSSKAKRFSQTFENCFELETIRLIQFNENCTFYNAFRRCDKLKNITVEGTIGQNGLDFQWSPLSKESIENIISVLSAESTGKTVTFKKSAVNTAFETSEGAADGRTSEKWLALVATKPNWTITLA